MEEASKVTYPVKLRAAGEPIMLTVIFLLILVVRLHFAFSYWPYLWYWDEWQVFRGSMRMLEQGNPLIPFFNYGLLPVTLAALVSVPTYLWLRMTGELPSPETLRPWPEYEWSVGYPEFLASQRLMWLTIGLLAILLVWFTTRYLFGGIAASVAACVFGINGLAHTSGSTLMVDGLAVCLVAAVLMTSVVALSSRKSFLFLIAGGTLAGMAAATKYNYGAILMAPLVASFLLSRSSPLCLPQVKKYLAIAASALLGFVLSMPAVLSYPRLFLQALEYERDHYQIGSPGAESEPWIGQALFQANSVLDNLGWLAVISCVLGLVGMMAQPDHRRTLAVLLAPAAVFLPVMLSGRLNYHRNFLFLYPQIAILAGFGVIVGGAVISKLSGREAMRKWTIPAMAALVITPLLIVVTRQAIDSEIHEDTRTLALNEVLREACLSESPVTVFLQSELNWPYVRDHRSCTHVSIDVQQVSAVSLANLQEPGDFAIVSPNLAATIPQANLWREIHGSSERETNEATVPRYPILNPSVSIVRFGKGLLTSNAPSRSVPEEK